MKKLADVNMVVELMLGLITRTWERSEPFIIEYRKRFKWPQALKWFENLYNEMKRTTSQGQQIDRAAFIITFDFKLPE